MSIPLLWSGYDSTCFQVVLSSKGLESRNPYMPLGLQFPQDSWVHRKEYLLAVCPAPLPTCMWGKECCGMLEDQTTHHCALLECADISGSASKWSGSKRFLFFPWGSYLKCFIRHKCLHLCCSWSTSDRKAVCGMHHKTMDVLSNRTKGNAETLVIKIGFKVCWHIGSLEPSKEVNKIHLYSGIFLELLFCQIEWL